MANKKNCCAGCDFDFVANPKNDLGEKVDLYKCQSCELFMCEYCMALHGGEDKSSPCGVFTMYKEDGDVSFYSCDGCDNWFCGTHFDGWYYEPNNGHRCMSCRPRTPADFANNLIRLTPGLDFNSEWAQVVRDMLEESRMWRSVCTYEEEAYRLCIATMWVKDGRGKPPEEEDKSGEKEMWEFIAKNHPKSTPYFVEFLFEIRDAINEVIRFRERVAKKRGREARDVNVQ